MVGNCITKMKKVAVATAFAVLALFPVTAHAICLTPICIFERILKACPGLPTLDFVAIIPAIGEVIPAVAKQVQVAVQERLNEKEQEEYKGEDTDPEPMEDMPSMEVVFMDEDDQFYSLLPFDSLSAKDTEDPMEISKAIEVLFLRPGWKSREPVSMYDDALLRYYADQFKLNNTIEVIGFMTVLKARMLHVLEHSKSIADRLDTTGGDEMDLNKAQRLMYEANVMRYQLSILENQMTAAKNQMYFASQLAGMNLRLYRPMFNDSGI